MVLVLSTSSAKYVRLKQTDKMIQPYNRLKVILHGYQKEAAQILPSIKLYCDYIDEIAAYDGILYKDTA